MPAAIVGITSIQLATLAIVVNVALSASSQL